MRDVSVKVLQLGSEGLRNGREGQWESEIV